MNKSEANELLLEAKTAEETKRALDMGADVNAKNKYGETALLCAKTAEQTKLLIEAGADVNAKDEYGDTALRRAKTAEQTKLLIEAGADVNAKDEYGDTALMFAKTAEQTKLLIEAGADVNVQNEDGNTALIFAETAEQTKLLIEAGADVNAKNVFGSTALMLARTAEQAILLLQAGAKLEDLEKNSDLSPTDLTKVIKFLIESEAQKVKTQVDREVKERELEAHLAKAKKRLQEQPKDKGVSGVVIADKIAETQISGKEKRVITPQVGKELRQEYMKDIASKGSRS